MSSNIEQVRAIDAEDTRGEGVLALLLIWLLAVMLLWLLAFLELPSGTPEWLKRTQLACFGSDESGLPSSAGWLVLTLGPLMFLGGLLVSLPREFSGACRLVQRQPILRATLVVLAAVALIEAVWVSNLIQTRLRQLWATPAEQSLEHLPDNYPMTNLPAPNFSLVDQNGEIKTLHSFRGKPLLVSFVFAHCQAVCPTLVRTITAAHRNSAASIAAVALVTLDPWRDTPSRLPELAKQWNLEANEFILTGPPEAVDEMLDAYGMPRKRNEQSGEVDHPALVKVINSKGEIVYTFNAPTITWIEDAIVRAGS